MTFSNFFWIQILQYTLKGSFLPQQPAFLCLKWKVVMIHISSVMVKVWNVSKIESNTSSTHQPLTSSSVLCKKCCLPLHKRTNDAGSKKTQKNEPFYSSKYLWYSLIHSHITFCLQFPQFPTIILEFLFPDIQIMILDLFPPTILHICQYNWCLSHSLPYAFYSLLSASQSCSSCFLTSTFSGTARSLLRVLRSPAGQTQLA